VVTKWVLYTHNVTIARGAEGACDEMGASGGKNVTRACVPPTNVTLFPHTGHNVTRAA